MPGALRWAIPSPDSSIEATLMQRYGGRWPVHRVITRPIRVISVTLSVIGMSATRYRNSPSRRIRRFFEISRLSCHRICPYGLAIFRGPIIRWVLLQPRSRRPRIEEITSMYQRPNCWRRRQAYMPIFHIRSPLSGRRMKRRCGTMSTPGVIIFLPDPAPGRRSIRSPFMHSEPKRLPMTSPPRQWLGSETLSRRPRRKVRIV